MVPSYEFLNIAKTGGVAPAPARPSIKVEIEAPTVLGFAVELVGAQSDPLLGRFRLAEDRLRVERDTRDAKVAVGVWTTGNPSERLLRRRRLTLSVNFPAVQTHCLPPGRLKVR